MSLLSKKGLLHRIRKSKEARHRLVESNLAKGIAYQIRATREKQSKTQAQLAEETGMSPNNLCRLESPEYGKQTISSLKRIAEALDVALIVRLVPFSQYVDWLSGTPHLDEGLSASSLSPSDFTWEDEHGVFDSETKYWGVLEGNPDPVLTTGTYEDNIQRVQRDDLSPVYGGEYEEMDFCLQMEERAS